MRQLPIKGVCKLFCSFMLFAKLSQNNILRGLTFQEELVPLRVTNNVRHTHKSHNNLRGFLSNSPTITRQFLMEVPSGDCLLN